jgi:hypothetical protein
VVETTHAPVVALAGMVVPGEAGEALMAGTGFHPEGHIWKPYTGTRGKWICGNCAEVVEDQAKASGECIDDC